MSLYPSLFQSVSILALTLAAAFTDWRSGHIPNRLTLPPILLAPLMHGIFEGPSLLLTSLMGILVCGLVPYILFIRAAIGGGDVKLFAAIGAIAGIDVGIEIQLFSFIIAMLYAVGLLSWRGELRRTLLNSLFIVVNPLVPRQCRRDIESASLTSIKMGTAICLASLLSVSSPIIGIS